MKVKFFADIRPLAGCDELEWQEAAPTVGALLAGLARRLGVPFGKRVIPDGALSATIILMVNGRNVHLLQGLETPLAPDDTVVVFPMVAGG
ncbi:MAG: MoaD/ThiS family protein [Candidatus Polarisedimenticolia bacterium]|nr:MoaD/ThiS family protein [bacterium]